MRLSITALCGALALIACSSEESPGGPATPDETVAVVDDGRQIDPATGLVMAEGWELVAANCVACHSAKQFLRQRGTRQTWQDVIDWMQATQGLWQFPDGVEERIVDYLATHYGPGDDWRRAPIPASLMPPNPYASGIREQVERLREQGELSPATGSRRR